MADYPGAIKNFTDVTDDVTEMEAVNVNSIYAEVEAIEAELGTDPAGTAATVKARLAQSLDGLGNLDFFAVANLGIVSGAVTPIQNWHTVDVESGSVDDLVTITATNCTDGFILFLRQVNDARIVIFKHGSGNILSPDGLDIVLASTTQVVVLVYDGTLTKWLVVNTPSKVPITLTPAAAVSMDCDLSDRFILTPAEAETITPSGGYDGQIIILEVVTSGTTTYDLTFAANFKGAATLATGATTAKKFLLEFYFDGTDYLELKRTTAL